MMNARLNERSLMKKEMRIRCTIGNTEYDYLRKTANIFFTEIIFSIILCFSRATHSLHRSLLRSRIATPAYSEIRLFYNTACIKFDDKSCSNFINTVSTVTR